MMCMHILETMNSIVSLWWFEVGRLVLGQYCNGKISIFYKYADFKQQRNFFVVQKTCYKIMTFSSDKMKQTLIA